MPQTIRTSMPVLLLAVALGSPPALAANSPEEGIVLMAGKWLFDVETRLPMQAKPSVQTFQTCMTSEPLTASTLMPWAESQGCKIGSVKAIENKLTWKLRCKRDGQKSRGRGEFKVDGERGEGKVKVSFEMGGRRLLIITKWQAKRVGDCTAATGSDLLPSVLE